MEIKTTSIGDIGNYYGGLAVKAESDKFYWSIENYDGHYWEEIPESLYLALVAYEEKRQAPNVEVSEGGTLTADTETLTRTRPSLD